MTKKLLRLIFDDIPAHTVFLYGLLRPCLGLPPGAELINSLTGKRRALRRRNDDMDTDFPLTLLEQRFQTGIYVCRTSGVLHEVCQLLSLGCIGSERVRWNFGNA